MSLLLQFPHPISLSKTSSLPPFHPLSTPKHSILSFCSTQSNSLSQVRMRRGVLRKGSNTPMKSLSMIFHHKVSILNAELRYSCRFITTQKNVRARCSTVCCYTSLRPETLQWVCTVSSAVLMLTKGTTIQKSFLVPLFALQAPTTVISWIKGEYGGWSAFLALLVRLFYYIPGGGTQAGAVISLAMAGFLALQHFSRIGSLQRAFDQGSIVATLAIICITIVPCLFLF